MQCDFFGLNKISLITANIEQKAKITRGVAKDGARWTKSSA